MGTLPIKRSHWGLSGEGGPLFVEVLKGLEKIRIEIPHGMSQLQFNQSMRKLEEFVSSGKP